MTFEGIPLAALDFYEDLEDDNSKAFWASHKSVYEECVKAPMEALVAELAPEFGPGKLFRPYRDTRFARDKTPYKVNQGAWFNDSSVYVHVDAAGLMLAGGYWQTLPAQIERLRRAIADDVAGAELERAISKVTGAGFDIGGQQLVRVPPGYPKDHPRADLLRFKTLTARRQFGAPAWLPTKRAKTEITKSLRTLAPVTEWLEAHVGAPDPT